MTLHTRLRPDLVADPRRRSLRRTLSALRALHRAALSEALRRPLAAVVGLTIPIGSILLITATDLVVGGAREITRAAMPTLLAVLLATVPFGALAAPVADARERGALRLLATVPLHRGALLLAHTPLALAASAIVVAAGLTAAGTHLGAVPAALVACGGLCAVGIGLGSLAGALSSRTSQVRALGTIVPAGVLLTAGALPFEAFMPGADRVLGFVPTTVLARVLTDALSGGGPELSAAVFIAAAGVTLWALGVALCKR